MDSKVETNNKSDKKENNDIDDEKSKEKASDTDKNNPFKKSKDHKIYKNLDLKHKSKPKSEEK